MADLARWPARRRRAGPLALAVLAAPIVLGDAGGSRPASPVPAVVDAAGLSAALAAGGRPRLVHVWATWCMPCVAEWPVLAAALRPHAGRTLEVVLLALDDPAQAAAAGRILAGAPALAARSLLAPPAVAYAPLRRLDPAWDGALPLTLAWDAGGKRLLAQRGLTRLDELRRVLETLASTTHPPSGRAARLKPSQPGASEGP
ncbi:MAG TPA: TlpA disulfide reductase family protein [Thermoanaerobaculia bacterium]|nr:TlpA disulfide reductase family protein [Thermoanaerobaculia bacterium]